jgi:chemotaxis protein MotB
MSGHPAEDDGQPPFHEEHVSHEEPWLVSYADMMTLLFGFFVLMYAFAAAKLDKLPDESLDSFVLMRKEVAKHFGGTYTAPLEQAAEALKQAVKDSSPATDLSVKLTPEGIEATFTSQALFASGSADLAGWAGDTLTAFAKTVLAKGSEYRVVVEGHTDDAPIVAAKGKFPTNWELSGARASAVVRLFADAGFKEDRLMAIGFGSSRPSVPNRDADGAPAPDNMAKNRRITIKVAVMDDGKGRAPTTETFLRSIEWPRGKGSEEAKP